MNNYLNYKIITSKTNTQKILYKYNPNSYSFSDILRLENLSYDDFTNEDLEELTRIYG